MEMEKWICVIGWVKTVYVFMSADTWGSSHTAVTLKSVWWDWCKKQKLFQVSLCGVIHRTWWFLCARQAPGCWHKNSCMCTWIYFVCSRLPVSVFLPSQAVRLNTVCCLKETDLMANDIWQRPSVMVMWYSLRAAEASLRDVVWPWIHAWKK